MGENRKMERLEMKRSASRGGGVVGGEFSDKSDRVEVGTEGKG